ncbi:class I SAM-dependent methyltransferase [Kitasatospora aureofaciens]|uniref:class I SAM-dependent methyltransferase n=1 Tax=Kitasatospora aureofaciens TaxID=1894 RepID=UPI0033FABC3B
MTTEQLRPDSGSLPQNRSSHPSPYGGDRLLFLTEALRTFHDTGALAPSGPDLVDALVVPVTSRPNRPISVLEVGAGTGVVTRRLARVLRPGDRLHVVEANPRFAERLRDDPVLAARRPEVGLRLSVCRVEELPEATDGPGPDSQGGAGRYDVIVSGLPFTNFEPALVRQVLALYLRLLAPGGELTYFGYLGTSTARTLVSGPRRVARHRAVVRLLRRFEATYGLGERTVWRNLPPARAHLLRSPGPYAWRKPPGSGGGRPRQGGDPAPLRAPVRTNDKRQRTDFEICSLSCHSETRVTPPSAARRRIRPWSSHGLDLSPPRPAPPRRLRPGHLRPRPRLHGHVRPLRPRRRGREHRHHPRRARRRDHPARHR